MTTDEFAWICGSYGAVVTVLAFLNLRYLWAGALAAVLLAAPVLLLHVILFAEYGPSVLWWPLSSPLLRPDFTVWAFVAYVAHLALLAWSISVPIRLLMASWRRWGRRCPEAASPSKDPAKQHNPEIERHEGPGNSSDECHS